MSEYDSESGRGTRENEFGRTFAVRRALRPLEQYAALEYPRENVTWVLRTAELARAKSRTAAEENVRKDAGAPATGARAKRSEG